jgi:hypothetical protein
MDAETPRAQPSKPSDPDNVAAPRATAAVIRGRAAARSGLGRRRVLALPLALLALPFAGWRTGGWILRADDR